MLTLSHQLLLKAALLPPALALNHWQTLQRRAEYTTRDPFNGLDTDSQRLLPLIFRNLEATDDPLLPQLRVLYLRTWQTNHRLLHTLYPALDALQANGIETMLLKGIPVALRYYGDLGVRPTADIDLMVPVHQADQALALLQQPDCGFRPTRFELRHRRLLHAMHLFNTHGSDIDLHWHLLYQHAYSGADQPFWADKQPLQLPSGQVVYRLSATHQVFHNLVHGYQWGESAAIRWIPDTYYICQSHDPVDWHALLDLAERYQMRIPVNEGLSLLQSLLGLELPVSVQTRLAGLVPEPDEAAYFRLLKPVSNPVHKAQRFIHKICLAHRIFRQGRDTLSFPAYLLRSLRFRIEWPYGDLYPYTQRPPLRPCHEPERNPSVPTLAGGGLATTLPATLGPL